MADHNPQHGRRPHFHRGRRGPDRRGGDRRSPREHAPESNATENTRDSGREGGVDVERIMREIRSRIAQRHGIELSAQQIQELAARRLEAILEPRNVKPQLLEQLRRSAGSAPDVPSSPAIETYEFEETTLFETHRGIVRFFRQLLNPILKLFFNPAPLITALNTQVRINKELAARELERERRQSEWNALQYELVQRVVLEMSRISLEMQALGHRVESLGTKVDFNERRVRGLESVPSAGPSKQISRQPEPVAALMPAVESTTSEPAPTEGTGEGTRRRRRRRRGRRSGGGAEAPAAAGTATAVDEEADTADVMEGDDEEAPTQPEAVAAPNAPLQEPRQETPPAFQPVADAPLAPPPEPAHSPEPVVPTPPRDEPVPADPVDHADPGPVDR